MSHSPIAEQVERWLVANLHRDVSLPPRAGTPAQLLAAVRAVLDRRPSLAEAARRLSAFDQFRLTLELARAAGAIPSIRVTVVQRGTACAARRPGRSRLPAVTPWLSRAIARVAARRFPGAPHRCRFHPTTPPAAAVTTWLSSLRVGARARAMCAHYGRRLNSPTPGRIPARRARAGSWRQKSQLHSPETRYGVLRRVPHARRRFPEPDSDWERAPSAFRDFAEDGLDVKNGCAVERLQVLDQDAGRRPPPGSSLGAGQSGSDGRGAGAKDPGV